MMIGMTFVHNTTWTIRHEETGPSKFFSGKVYIATAFLRGKHRACLFTQSRPSVGWAMVDWSSKVFSNAALRVKRGEILNELNPSL